jgi:membrane protease YdiL (CAAX protease family)
MKTLFFIGFLGDKMKKSIGNAFSRLISVTFFGLSHTLGHSEHVEGAGFIKLAVIYVWSYKFYQSLIDAIMKFCGI